MQIIRMASIHVIHVYISLKIKEENIYNVIKLTKDIIYKPHTFIAQVSLFIVIAVTQKGGSYGQRLNHVPCFFSLHSGELVEFIYQFKLLDSSGCI